MLLQQYSYYCCCLLLLVAHRTRERNAMRSNGFLSVLSLLVLAKVGANDEEEAARERSLYFKKWRTNPKVSGHDGRSSLYCGSSRGNCKKNKLV